MIYTEYFPGENKIEQQCVLSTMTWFLRARFVPFSSAGLLALTSANMQHPVGLCLQEKENQFQQFL
jgi:hypothetical protein